MGHDSIWCVTNHFLPSCFKKVMGHSLHWSLSNGTFEIWMGHSRHGTIHPNHWLCHLSWFILDHVLMFLVTFSVTCMVEKGGVVTCVAVHPTELCLATGCQDGKIILWYEIIIISHWTPSAYQLQSMEYTCSIESIGCIGRAERPIELLLGKVKKASGRIGIFLSEW